MTINDFKDVTYIPMQGQKNFTIREAINNFLYYRLKINTKHIRKIIEKIYKREVKRVFPNLKFDYAIHYSGYEKNAMNLIRNMDCKKMIYVHNDLVKEETTKGNFDRNSLIEAYRSFDEIVTVRDTQKGELTQYLKNTNKDKVKLAHNINNIELIKENATKDIEFNEDTFCNVSIEELDDVLNNKKIKKFINISRFSPEKGQDMLIEAFNNYRKIEKNKDDYLILIGGYGNTFDDICEMAEKKENIIVIKSIINPYPILNKCDCFVLSSRYEGLPMVIMEALILNKPVISTNITGPKEFLENGYGYLVQESIDGLEKGMIKYKNEGLNSLTKFNAEKFNEQAIIEFEKLFK